MCGWIDDYKSEKEVSVWLFVWWQMHATFQLEKDEILCTFPIVFKPQT